MSEQRLLAHLTPTPGPRAGVLTLYLGHWASGIILGHEELRQA